MRIKIGKKIIGESEPCFIIAEAGVNHNGDIRLAKQLVDAAAKAGADAVKFQTFTPENLVTKEAVMAWYQKRNVGRRTTQFAMLKKLQLYEKDFIALKTYCEKRKIIFLSTPHTEDAVDFLEPLVPAYKVGSGDLTNISFLKKIAGKKKPVILSTGMATLKEVRQGLDAVDTDNAVLLHCTTNYPCPLKEVNLKAMATLKKVFPVPIGYSDHTIGTMIPVMAVALGAQVLEKHFTLNRTMPGPDHKASLQPEELKKMIEHVRSAEQALGSSNKRPTKSEEEIKKIVRKSLVAKQDIPKGTLVTKKMLTIKRPGTGLNPVQIGKIIGMRACKNIKRDSLIQHADLCA